MAQTPAKSALPARRLQAVSASGRRRSARVRVLQANFMRRLSQSGTSPVLSTKRPKIASTPDMTPYTLLNKIHHTAVEVSPVEVIRSTQERVADDMEPRRTSDTTSMFELSTPTDEHESGRPERRHRRPLPTQVNAKMLAQRMQQALHGKDQSELEHSATSSFSLRTPLDSEEEDDDDAIGVKRRRNHMRRPTQRVNKKAISQGLQQLLREDDEAAEEDLPAPTTGSMAGWTIELPVGELASSPSYSSHTKGIPIEHSRITVGTQAAVKPDSPREELGGTDGDISDSMKENNVPVVDGSMSAVIRITLSPDIGTQMLSRIHSGLQDRDTDGTGPAAELEMTGKRGKMYNQTSAFSQITTAERSSADLVDAVSAPHLSHTSPVREEPMGEEEGEQEVEEEEVEEEEVEEEIVEEEIMEEAEMEEAEMEEAEMESAPETDIAEEALVPGGTHNLAASSNEEEEDNGSSIDEEEELQVHKMNISSKLSPDLHTPASFTRHTLAKGKQKRALKTKKPASKRGNRQNMLTIPLKTIKDIFLKSVPCRLNKLALLAIEERLPMFLEQMLDDLETFASHAGRKTITIADVELLMKRQRYVTNRMPLTALVREHLPMEMRVELLDTLLGKVLPPLPRKHK